MSEGVALAGVAVVVGVEADDFEPGAGEGGHFEGGDGGDGGGLFCSRSVGTAGEDGHLGGGRGAKSDKLV